MRAALLILLLAGCAAEPLPAPVAEPSLTIAPLHLRPCLPPVPPPPVPGLIRDERVLGAYGSAEAKARWETADRLAACARQVERAIPWVDQVQSHLAQRRETLAP